MEKEIKLKKLRMNHFKAFRDFEVNFSDRTVISGRNASGKSTIFDAWSWLLFGKDSLGSADFQIKTLDENGNVIEKVDHEVYGELEINGSITTLKRILRENWVKPKGQEVEYLKGNETKCFFDGVPISVGEYQKRVNDIVDENIFKLITNTSYFHSLKKEDRRNILISLAGDISDDEIAKNNGDLSEIVELMKTSSNEDIKKRIAAEKKRINAEAMEIPIRISELQRNMPEVVDFKAIEKKINGKKKELSEIDKLLSDEQEKVKAKINKANKKRKEIGELRLQQQDILIEAELESARLASEKNKDFLNFGSILKDKLDKSSRAEKRVLEKKNDISDINYKISELNREREKLVEQWKEESAKQYVKKDGCLICPLYNHECTDNEALFKFSQGTTDAEAEFNARRSKRIAEINEQGLSVKDKISANTKALSEYEKELLSLKSEHESIFEDYTAFSNLTPVEYKPEPVIKENIPEWAELEAKINSINVKEVEFDNSELNEKRKSIEDEISTLQAELIKKVQIENTFKRIDELQKEQRRLAQALSEQESIENKLLKFNKIKMEEVGKRVNDKFKYVTFKLFDKTLDGNDFETCETLIDGVPYFSANNAARINGALDIISTVCEYNGIFAPIMIDNSESVNEIIPTKSQLILLEVTKGNFTINNK
ncbi:MAG: ATP-binding protein [Petrimonas sp.]|nr:ATP-binding protein [Petrimonas sp.]